MSILGSDPLLLLDVMNHVTQMTVHQAPSPDAVTVYSYDWSGLLRTMLDPNGNQYTWWYDPMGRKVWMQYPVDSSNAQRCENWVYENTGNGTPAGNGNLYQFKDRTGSFFETFTYDNLNRLTLSHWNDNGATPDVSIGYDAASRVTSTSNSPNATIARSYYDDNLLNSETTTYADNVARTVSYTYDEDGRRKSLQYPGGAYTFNYAYTGRSQLKTITNNATGSIIATYGYDADCNLKTRALDNSNTSSTYGYDALNQVTSISHALNGTTRTFGYNYDSVGNRLWVKRDGGNGDAYGYDLNDQVTFVKLNTANPDSVVTSTANIIYDANGNRKSFNAYGTNDTYTTNALNQYTSRTSSSTSAVYDPNANMTTGLDASTYSYDSQKRLLTAIKGSTTDNFAYDGLNRQVSRKVGSAAIIYNVYDGWDLIGEYAPGSTTASKAYLYGAGGMVKNLTANRYYYQDGSGSTSHLADGNGALTEWYRYDLQGKPLFYNGSDQQISGSTTTNGVVRHLFTGQQWYREIGLYDLRNRYYSPDIGRFLQADPSGFNGDASNLYRYCGNNPLTRSDRSGLGVFKADGVGGGDWGDRIDSIRTAWDTSGGAPGFGPVAGGVDLSWISEVTVAQANSTYGMCLSASNITFNEVLGAYGVTVAGGIATSSGRHAAGIHFQGDAAVIQSTLNYLQRYHPMADVIHVLYISGSFTISTNSTTDNVGVPDDRFSARTQTVHWNPNVELYLLGGGVLSPAIALGHELGHASDYLDPATFWARRWTEFRSSDPLGPYDNLEEYHVISGLETSTENYFDQPTRTDHHFHGSGWVPSPFPRGG